MDPATITKSGRYHIRIDIMLRSELPDADTYPPTLPTFERRDSRVKASPWFSWTEKARTGPKAAWQVLDELPRETVTR